MKLWIKIFLAMVFGIFFGLVFGEKTLILKEAGQLFLQLINMITPLLIFSTVAVGITSIHEPKKMGKVGVLTLTYYLMTTIAAVLIGSGCTYFLSPGSSLQMTLVQGVVYQADFSEIFVSLMPQNPIKAMVDNNVLQIIFFAILMGLAINFSGKKGLPLLRTLESVADVVNKLTAMIVQFTPFCVFAIMAYVTGSFGFAVLLPLSKFLAILYLSFFLHLFVVLFSLLKWVGRVNPISILKIMLDAMMIAFSTCSSSALIPISLECVKKAGVSEKIANFMIPLGATVNMNGTALFQASAAFFIAQAYGITLSWEAMVVIVLSATLSAIGTAGIPGSGIIMLSAVVSSAGLPIEGIALLIGIDRFREMGATVINVFSDAVCAICVARTLNEFDALEEVPVLA